MPKEYDIQKRLTYLGIGSLIAAPFTGGLTLIPTAGIFLGKAGRYIRREFDEEFAKKYPLEKSPSKNYFQKTKKSIKNFFKGFKYEHSRTREKIEKNKKEGKLENLMTNIRIFNESGEKIEEYWVRKPEEFIEQYLTKKRKTSCHFN